MPERSECENHGNNSVFYPQKLNCWRYISKECNNFVNALN